jgi:hypothetical protein
LISARRVRRNTEKLREQVRQLLSLLDEVEQYRIGKVAKS